jgi:putative DNA primase/helicase
MSVLNGLEPHPLADAPSGADDPAALPTGDPLPNEPRTELGYAHRFVAVYGDQVRFVATWAAGHQWLIWDGCRWAADTTGQAKRWMKTIARTVTVATYAISDEGQRKQAVKEAKRGESSSAVNGALALASTDVVIVVSHEDLDSDPYLLNCANGTLNLRTGTLQPHDPNDLLTKVAGTVFDPQRTLEGSEFQRFFDRIQPDPEMRTYLARLIGHTLVGELVEHVLPIWWGDGANGKSTLLDVILGALGDYASMAAPGLLTARSFDAHPTEIADLFGLRLAGLDETDDGRRLAEGTVKRLTGDRRQKARRMRENFWEFDTSHTFVMLTNHKPLVAGTDEGIWRRLRLIPFQVVIPKEERDEHLPTRLERELDIVLAWLVAGCLAWQRRGLDEPATVVEATDAYRAESDAIGRFLAERCVQAPTLKAQSSALFAAWSRWCVGEGLEAGTNKGFTTALHNRGFDTVKSKGRMVWQDLGLASEETGPDD